MHAGEKRKQLAQVLLDLGELPPRGGKDGERRRCPRHLPARARRRLRARADKDLQLEPPDVENGGAAGEVHVRVVAPQLDQQPFHKALGQPGHGQYVLARGQVGGRKRAHIELVLLRLGQQSGHQELVPANAVHNVAAREK